MTRRPLAIVGPTASGKSSLAMALARRLGDIELVSVDSMQVYRGMDIGTAKPTTAEQAEVPHHLLDLLDPDEESSVSWFQAEATAALAGIAERGADAILVGGSGLYHRAVIDAFEIPGRWPEIAAELEAEPDSGVLYQRLLEVDPDAARRIESTNRRRLVRALEVTLGSERRFSTFGPGLEAYPPSRVVQVGLRMSRLQLAKRVALRFHQQLDEGLLDELRTLDARPEGWSRTAEQALGYRELRQHLNDGQPLDDSIDEAILRIRRFAARQDRWFRRDPRITWFDAEQPDLVDEVQRVWDESGPPP